MIEKCQRCKKTEKELFKIWISSDRENRLLCRNCIRSLSALEKVK